MTSEIKRLKLWAPVVLWAALIFSFSHIPYLQSGMEQDFLLRKAAHFSEYFILTLLLYRAFRGTFALSAGRLILYPAFSSFLYAVSDEIHQSFIPGRECALRDVLIDFSGALFFCLVILLRAKLRRPSARF